MQILNRILIFVFVALISFIDFNNLSNGYKCFSFKNILKKNSIFNFCFIIFISLYMKYVFNGISILYFINFICFLGVYICTLTDIYSKHIYDLVVILFSIPIIILNCYGMYFKISVYGFISATFLYGIIYIVSRIIYKKEVFGIGDIYVLSLVGISTDMVTVFNIGLFAFVFAGLFIFIKFVIMFFSGFFTKFNVEDFEKLKKEEIAFVPFILISYLLLIYF